MSGSVSFSEAVGLAKAAIGPCSRSTLWLVLSKWAREGKPIDSLACVAAATSVTGSKAVWCK